jgi:hypothetical protein
MRALLGCKCVYLGTHCILGTTFHALLSSLKISSNEDEFKIASLNTIPIKLLLLLQGKEVPGY